MISTFNLKPNGCVSSRFSTDHLRKDHRHYSGKKPEPAVAAYTSWSRLHANLCRISFINNHPQIQTTDFKSIKTQQSLEPKYCCHHHQRSLFSATNAHVRRLTWRGSTATALFIGSSGRSLFFSWDIAWAISNRSLDLSFSAHQQGCFEALMPQSFRILIAILESL